MPARPHRGVPTSERVTAEAIRERLLPAVAAPDEVDRMSRMIRALLCVALAATFAPAAAAARSQPASSRELYVDPDSSAKRQADEWRKDRPGDAAQMDKIATRPQAFWFGEWSGDVRTAVARVVDAAGGSIPVLVAYNIPGRDCGGHSAGGAQAGAYREWIRGFAEGIGDRNAIVVLEPDALAGMDCLSASGRSERIGLLREAVTELAARPGAEVYLDAGHSRWHPVREAARRLRDAGVARAAGFSLNVSNFNRTADEVAYGKRVSSRIGGARFVIDTGRNGAGPDPSGEWCNPPGRALGDAPTLRTGRSVVAAYLWVKRPGESDGSCNGGPPAGGWWAEYALDMARRTP